MLCKGLLPPLILFYILLPRNQTFLQFLKMALNNSSLVFWKVFFTYFQSSLCTLPFSENCFTKWRNVLPKPYQKSFQWKCGCQKSHSSEKKTGWKALILPMIKASVWFKTSTLTANTHKTVTKQWVGLLRIMFSETRHANSIAKK